MDAQDFRSLQEAYNQVYQEDWKSPNLQRMTSRLGSLEQQIPNNRGDLRLKILQYTNIL